MSNEFKALFGTISELDDDNRIIVQADPHFPQVATIKCDFFKVIEMCFARLSKQRVAGFQQGQRHVAQA